MFSYACNCLTLAALICVIGLCSWSANAAITSVITYNQRHHYQHPKLISHFPIAEKPSAIRIIWEHSVNSRTLLNQLPDDPWLVVEGDVVLSKRGIPVMAYPPNREDSLTLKQWLRIVGQKNRVMKLIFHKNDVVKPALDYLFAAKNFTSKPVILHARILPGPNHEIAMGEIIDPAFFISQTAKIFPWAVLSVGWQTDIEKEGSPRDYTWRDILDMLEWVFDVRQPIIFNFRAIYLKSFLGQLFWLLGIRNSFSLSIKCTDLDMITEWNTLVGLRFYADPERVFYDLTEFQREMLEDQYAQRHMLVQRQKTNFHRHAWRVVQFINAEATLSTIILSDAGVAFVGWPTAFLLATASTVPSAHAQFISGRVLFVPKRHFEVAQAFETGLSIFLLASVEDIPSPLLRGGIRLFIGHDGTLFIENRETDARTLKRRNFYPQVFAKIAQHECYAFSVEDTGGTEITLTVYASRYCTGANESTPHAGYYRQISLEVPVARRYRHVILQKSGDANMDLIVENLSRFNNNAANGLRGTEIYFLIFGTIFFIHNISKIVC